jgi:hypothetical protein
MSKAYTRLAGRLARFVYDMVVHVVVVGVVCAVGGTVVGVAGALNDVLWLVQGALPVIVAGVVLLVVGVFGVGMAYGMRGDDE